MARGTKKKRPASLADEGKSSRESMLNAYGLIEKSYAKVPSESMEDFIDRIVREMPKILVRAEGDCDIVALVFGCERNLVVDLVRMYPVLEEARGQGAAIAAARIKQSEEAAVAIKKKALGTLKDEDCRIRRKKWPKDPGMARVAQTAIMPRAIEDWEGDYNSIATALSMTITEVRSVIDEDEELSRLRQVAEESFDCRVWSNFKDHATRTFPAAHAYMKAKYPDVWGDKSKIDLKTTGFKPPSSGEQIASVLHVINGKKDEEEE